MSFPLPPRYRRRIPSGISFVATFLFDRSMKAIFLLSIYSSPPYALPRILGWSGRGQESRKAILHVGHVTVSESGWTGILLRQFRHRTVISFDNVLPKYYNADINLISMIRLDGGNLEQRDTIWF